MQIKIDFISKEKAEELRKVYEGQLKIEPSGDGENVDVTIQHASIETVCGELYIGGVHFFFADYGNVIIY